jgi:5S rRNA maturation endonuclease (ribonuclease M5)
MLGNSEECTGNKVKVLSTRLEEKQERILEILRNLADASASGNLIIVEGKKDVEALRRLGVEGRILSAKTGGKSILDVVSDVGNMGKCEVILLLDHDRRGKQLIARLKQHFERENIVSNTRFWSSLFSLIGKDVKDIEGLESYMETLKSKLSGNS